MDASELINLQHRLGHAFANTDLLRQALTHRSHGIEHNERLEFLGDGLLNLVAADLLFVRFPKADEGQLSRMRSHLVREDCLARIGQSLAVSGLLRIGEGERRSGGATRASMLADTVEALIGAVYLDAGFDTVHRIVSALLSPVLAQTDASALGKDAKTRLQEWLQGRHCQLPVYRVLQQGGTAQTPDFIIECNIEMPACTTQGQAPSRRQAEQRAAATALTQLEGQLHTVGASSASERSPASGKQV